MTLNTTEDVRYLPGLDEDLGYARQINAVGRDYIMAHYSSYEGPKPPPIDHQGIESAAGGGSVIFYFHKGKWLQLMGAD